ncbi:MAG: ArgE/DapE family deacylase [Candidatus Bathyarchaeia archaeon]
MNILERRILDSIDADQVSRLTGELVAVPSHGGDEVEAQKFMANRLRTIGLEVDTWSIDFEELRRHPAFSMSIDRREGLGVVGTYGNGAKSLILCGHIDTVGVGDPEKWDTNPLKAAVRDGRLYGLGVCDMKGGLASALTAVKALMDAGVELEGRLIYESCIGEEDGGCGALATCLRGYKADAGIIMEPTECKVAPEIAGAVSFRVTITGRSAHACVREEGESAIEKFVTIFSGLKELETERNMKMISQLFRRYRLPYALNVGLIHGGRWPGTVPDEVIFEARMGVGVGEEIAHAKAELEAKLREVSNSDPWLRDHPPKVEWSGYSFASSRIEVSHPIVETLTKSYREVTGLKPPLEGMPYASDARLLISIGETPTVVFGPGDVRDAHRPNESVSLEALENSSKILTLMILRFLGYKN